MTAREEARKIAELWLKNAPDNGTTYEERLIASEFQNMEKQMGFLAQGGARMLQERPAFIQAIDEARKIIGPIASAGGNSDWKDPIWEAATEWVKKYFQPKPTEKVGIEGTKN